MTYSIIARDADANQMGIAVQSHHISIGAHVIAAEDGIGVLAVQSFADRRYASDGLSLLRAGADATETLRSLIATHPRTERRAQVAVLATGGSPATYTGKLCISHSGHEANQHASAQSNMVRSPHVSGKMIEQFEASTGDLVARLLAALSAAEEEGGDWRGRQSAALLVVSITPEVAAAPIDLRVDDDPNPLDELRRLDQLRRAAVEMKRSFDVAASGGVDDAVAILDSVQDVYGANLEPTAWSAVLLARAGRVHDARSKMDVVLESEPGWAGLFRSLPDATLLPDEPALIDQILSEDPSSS